MPRPPQRSTLFPYTTLFRSRREHGVVGILRCGLKPVGKFQKLVGGFLGENARLLERYIEIVDRLLLSDRGRDRKSTRLNSSHVEISYAVFCLKKKKKKLIVQ